jgi:hypothetical protein
MAADEIRANRLSLADFERTIQSQRDENFVAGRVLTNEPESNTPTLGGFVEACRGAGRYLARRNEYPADPPTRS